MAQQPHSPKSQTGLSQPEIETALIYWSLRLVQAYHNDPTMNDTAELQQLVGWADELAAVTGINLAYLDKEYEQHKERQ